MDKAKGKKSAGRSSKDIGLSGCVTPRPTVVTVFVNVSRTRIRGNIVVYYLETSLNYLKFNHIAKKKTEVGRAYPYIKLCN